MASSTRPAGASITSSVAIASREDLEAFAAHLTAEGVAHAGVEPLPGFGHLIELHDPDGILVERHAATA